MKKIIKYFADKSGVTRQIQEDTLALVSKTIPLTELKKKPDAYNALKLLKSDLSEGLDVFKEKSHGARYLSIITRYKNTLLVNVNLQLSRKVNRK